MTKDGNTPTRVSVDLDRLTIGDLELFDEWQRGDVPLKQVLDVLDRAVEGGVRHLPVLALKDITDAIGAAVAEATDQKN